jgi:hypothetical protein
MTLKNIILAIFFSFIVTKVALSQPLTYEDSRTINNSSVSSLKNTTTFKESGFQSRPIPPSILNLSRPFSLPAAQMRAAFILDYYSAYAVNAMHPNNDVKSTFQSKLNNVLSILKYELNLTITPDIFINDKNQSDYIRYMLSGTPQKHPLDHVSGTIDNILGANNNYAFAIYILPDAELVSSQIINESNLTVGCLVGQNEFKLEELSNSHILSLSPWTARRGGACNGTNRLLPQEHFYNKNFIGNSKYAVANLFPSKPPFSPGLQIAPVVKEGVRDSCDPLGARTGYSILKTIGNLIGMKEIVTSSAMRTNPTTETLSWNHSDVEKDAMHTVYGNSLTRTVFPTQFSLNGEVHHSEFYKSSLMGSFHKDMFFISPISRSEYSSFQTPLSIKSVIWNGCGVVRRPATTATTINTEGYLPVVPVQSPYFIELPLTKADPSLIQNNSRYSIYDISAESSHNNKFTVGRSPQHYFSGNSARLKNLDSRLISFPEISQPVVETDIQQKNNSNLRQFELRLLDNFCNFNNSTINIAGRFKGPVPPCFPTNQTLVVERIRNESSSNQQKVDIDRATIGISFVSQAKRFGFPEVNQNQNTNQNHLKLNLNKTEKILINRAEDTLLANQIDGGDVYFIPDGVVLSSEFPFIDPRGYGFYHSDLISSGNLISSLQLLKDFNSLSPSYPSNYYPKRVDGYFNFDNLIQFFLNPLFYSNEGLYSAMIPANSSMQVKDGVSFSYVKKFIDDNCLNKQCDYRVGQFNGNSSEVSVVITDKVFKDIPKQNKDIISQMFFDDLGYAFKGKGVLLLVPKSKDPNRKFMFYSKSAPVLVIHVNHGMPTPTPVTTATAVVTVAPTPTIGNIDTNKEKKMGYFAATNWNRCSAEYNYLTRAYEPRCLGTGECKNAPMIDQFLAIKASGGCPEVGYCAPACQQVTVREARNEICRNLFGEDWYHPCEVDDLKPQSRFALTCGGYSSFNPSNRQFTGLFGGFEIECERSGVSTASIF